MTVYLGPHRVLMASESLRSQIMCCLYQMCFRSTRAPVRARKNDPVVFSRNSMKDRDLHDIPDELRGACGSRKIADWYVRMLNQ